MDRSSNFSLSAVTAPTRCGGSAERAGELIIHRPQVRAGGGARAFKIHLDGRRVAALAEDATVCVPATDGHHEVEVRCWPHARVRLAIDLAPHQIVRLQTLLSPLRELEIYQESAVVERAPVF